jgi:hypothetical protein
VVEDSDDHEHIMVFEAYPEEQRDMRIITVLLTSIATLLLFFRISATIRNRGWLGLEDAFVIAANVRGKRHYTHNNANELQFCLILLAACIYTSTTYGFGKRVADIKASGGDVKTAMKASTPPVRETSTLNFVNWTSHIPYTDLVSSISG